MKLILLICSLQILSISSFAAIAHDKSSSASVIEKKKLSWSHNTSTGADRILIVGITNGSGKTISSITYKNINLTQGETIVRNSMRTSLWYLIAPPTGLNNITITLSGKADIFAGANTFTGVDQSSPWGTFVKSSGKATSSSVLVSSASGELVVDVIGLIQANPSQGSGQSLMHKIGGALYNASSTEAGAGFVTMSWTHSEEDWGIVAAPLKPATAPLPVELLYFSAKPFSNFNVALSWATATEINNDFFTIEKSRDGRVWEVVKKVQSQGNGNSALIYTDQDTDPYFGQSYYRLKQTDFDRSFVYSEKIPVNIKAPPTKIVAYPNPISRGRNLSISIKLPINLETAKLEFINSFGVVVQAVNWNDLLEGTHSMSLPIAELPEGIFNIRFTSPKLKRPIFTNIIVTETK